MGTVPLEDKKRNKALLKDYYSKKYFMVDLVAKYRISSSRIYRIIAQYKKKSNLIDG